MNKTLKAALVRALWTLVEVMSASAIAVIGSATTLGEVDWKHVGSVVVLSGIISLLKSISVGMPEVKPDK